MKRACSLFVAVWLIVCSSARAGDRFPGERWLMYADPQEAGFAPAKLAEAEAYWDSLDSAALMVVYDGAVLVSWGDVERRFLLHSARKSLMSGLYGIHVDAGNIDIQKNMAQLGIDDVNPTLNDEEKQAKIIDLLQARSGVYHPAAAEPSQNPKPPRGSHKPGTHWCYNNWDFNALCTILEQEVGIKVFAEFKKRFAEPLGMQDYRARDGVYQYEQDKSIHPAYHFRMSARDMARFGLLYLNAGKWDGRQILSERWVTESTRSHSDDAWFGGYGYMWWVYFDEPFGSLKMYSALGVGEQSIDVIPGADMVVVVRTNTFAGNRVSQAERLELIKKILAAKTSGPRTTPKLVPLPVTPRPFEVAQLSPEEKQALCALPADPSTGRIMLEGGDLVLETPGGTFDLIRIAGDKLIVDDTYEAVHLERNADGSVARVFSEGSLNAEGYRLLQGGNTSKAIDIFKKAVDWYPDSANAYDSLGEAYMAAGDKELATANYTKSLELDPRNTNAVEMLYRLRGKEAGSGWQAVLPDSVAGRRAAAFYEAFNSGDDEQIRAFEKEHRAKSGSQKRTTEERLAQWRKLRDQWGTLTPMVILTNEKHVLVVFTKVSSDGPILEFRFELEDQPPFRMTALRITG